MVYVFHFVTHVYACPVLSDSLRPHRLTAYQAPVSMECSRQEYWSGLPFPPPGDLPDLGIEPMSPKSPELQADFFFLPLSHLGNQTSVGSQKKQDNSRRTSNSASLTMLKKVQTTAQLHSLHMLAR